MSHKDQEDQANIRRRLGTAAAVVLVSALVLHLILDRFYRPWAWANEASDLHFSDSFTNLTSVVIGSSMIVFVERARLWHSRFDALIVISPTLAFLAYECIQPLLPNGTFDFWDIGWTFVGGAIAFFVKLRVFDRIVTSTNAAP